MVLTQRHKVFVSYHHANDQIYRDQFEELFTNVYDIMVSKSVQIGDISTDLKTETIRQKIRDEYLRDSTVTVVLIGAETWKRKHVDWEISSSIRDTKNSSRSGLMGIILPSYPREDKTKYSRYTIPPRLHDNIACEFASIYNWSYDPQVVQRWIHDAFLRRNRVNPDNSRDLFRENRSSFQTRWQN